MFKFLKRFVRGKDGQDLAEYTLILGAVGVVAIAVIAQYKTELLPFGIYTPPLAVGVVHFFVYFPRENLSKSL